jgi:hypothetical protein
MSKKNQPITPDYKSLFISLSQINIEIAQALMSPNHIPVIRFASLNAVAPLETVPIEHVTFLNKLTPDHAAKLISFWLSNGIIPHTISPVEPNTNAILLAARHNSYK